MKAKPSGQQPPLQRYHSLDALRAAMMLLGLVLHSAASYTKTPLREVWPYQDAQTNVAFDLLIFFIHIFRMPVFFLVAGFLGALLYRRDGPAGFARNRARRVLLPLVLFWGAVLPLVAIGIVFALHQRGLPPPWTEIVSQQPLLRKPILGHLWFLYDLLLFYIAAALVVPLAARLPAGLHRRADVVFRSIATTKWGVLVLAAITMLTLVWMRVPGIETSAALLPPIRVLAAYGVFFAFGWLLYGHRDILASFGGRWTLPLTAGLGMSVVYLIVLVRRGPEYPGSSHVTAIALASVSMWLLIFGIVGVFVRHMEKPRPLVRYFSDASYWMYLVHLPFTIWLPGALARSTAPAVVKFAIVLAGTTLATTVTYHYMVRSTVIGELLNGRRYPRSWPIGRRVGDEASAAGL